LPAPLSCKNIIKKFYVYVYVRKNKFFINTDKDKYNDSNFAQYTGFRSTK